MSEKNQIAPIGPDDPKTEASLDEKKPSADRRQFITGVASAIGAGVILNAAASSAVGQTAIGNRQIISFKLTKDDLGQWVLFGFFLTCRRTPFAFEGLRK